MDSNRFREDIVESYNKTTQNLKDIWDDVGLSSSDRESGYAKLASRVKEVLQEEVKKQESQKDLLKRELLNGLETVCKLCTSLGEPVKDVTNYIVFNW